MPPEGVRGQGLTPPAAQAIRPSNGLLYSPAMALRSFALIVGILVVAGSGVEGQRGRGAAQPITIKAARVIDGRGAVLDNAVVTVTGSKITAVGPQTPEMGALTYDVGSATLMPG